MSKIFLNFQTNFEEVYDVSGRSTSSEALADTEESRNDCRINVRKGSETRGRGNRDQVRDREELGDVRGLDVEELRQENNKLKNFARQVRVMETWQCLHKHGIG